MLSCSVLTPWLVWMWQQGHGQFSSLAKMALGSCIAGFAYLVLAFASAGRATYEIPSFLEFVGAFRRI